MNAVRMTDRRLWGVIALALFLASWLGGRLPWLLFEALAATVIIDYLWLLFYHNAFHANLELSSHRFHAGQAKHGLLTIANRRRFGLTADLLADGIVITRQENILIPAGGSWRRQVRIMFARRGEQMLPPVLLRIASPFRIWHIVQTLVPARTVVVYPALARTFSGTIARPSSQAATAGYRASVFNPDHLDTRPYVPGDPPQRIHWKLSARHGRLYVRKDQAELPGALILVLDCLPLDDAPQRADRRYEAVVSLAAGLAAEAVKQKYRFVMIALGVRATPFRSAESEQPYDGAMLWLSRLPVHDALPSRSTHERTDEDPGELILNNIPGESTRALLVTARQPYDPMLRPYVRALSGRITVDFHTLGHEQVEAVR